MATQNPTPEATASGAEVGVRMGVGSMGHRSLYGSKPELLAHPACPPGIFDGEGQTWRTQRTVTTPEPRTVQVLKMGRGRYRLVLRPNDSELAAARARRAQQAQAKTAETSLREAASQLKALPKSAAEWRAEAKGAFETFERMIVAAAEGRFGTVRGGYSLCADARNLVGIHLQAIRQAFETGNVVADAEEEQRVRDAIMAPSRQANPALTKLLRDLGAAR